MRIKRLLSLALSAALAAALAIPLPAGAAGSSSFADVGDGDTAVNADILRLMGVVDGTGGNLFQPGSTLSRAQFATMVVNFMQRGDEVAIHHTRTIFTDVPGSHWARGYVNLAASITLGDEEKPVALFAGVGDGRFRPDAPITQAEGATILLRMLGYTSQQTGAVWPQGYMDLAGAIGLTERLPGDYNAPLTREQAAQLLVNALRCKTAKGEACYTELGSKVQEDTIILAVGVRSDDGTSANGIRATSSKNGEAYLPAHGSGSPVALRGKRGALVLNDKDEIVTFVPDNSTAITIVLSGDARPSYVKGTDGKQYTMSGSTMLYTGDSPDGKEYREGYGALKSGMQITMYSERGKIVAVYGGVSSSTMSTEAVVVRGRPTVAMFHQLTGGASDFKIMKARQQISISQIQEYDVVTYDSLSNMLLVSDLRITGYYRTADPNPQAPTTVEFGEGNKFDVLESAWDTTVDMEAGGTVTALLTVDGKVAGLMPATARLQSNAVGLVKKERAEMFLPNGGILELKGKVTNGAMDGRLAVLSINKDNIGASALQGGVITGGFDIGAMTLSGHTVANGVHLFERVGYTMVELGIDRLEMGHVEEKDIRSYHLNSSGMVDFIEFHAVTGDAYTYGILEEGQQDIAGSGDLPDVSNRTVTVQNSKKTGPFVTGNTFKSRSFGGVAQGYGEIEGIPMAASIIQLTEIRDVKADAFFVSQGAYYVRADGKTYRVSDAVEGYQADSKIWFTFGDGPAEQRVSDILAYSHDLTIYVDPIGEKVRVIAAN